MVPWVVAVVGKGVVASAWENVVPQAWQLKWCEVVCNGCAWLQQAPVGSNRAGEGGVWPGGRYKV